MANRSLFILMTRTRRARLARPARSLSSRQEEHHQVNRLLDSAIVGEEVLEGVLPVIYCDENFLIA